MYSQYSIDFQQATDHQLSNLISLINRKYVVEPGSPGRRDQLTRYMDFGQKIHFYTMDFIGEFAFGEPFGFLEKDEDVRRMTEINDLSIRLMTVAGLMPWLAGLRSTWPFRLLLPQERDKVGFGTLFGCVFIISPLSSDNAHHRKKTFINSGKLFYLSHPVGDYRFHWLIQSASFSQIGSLKVWWIRGQPQVLYRRTT